jgi:hypothetical protein
VLFAASASRRENAAGKRLRSIAAAVDPAALRSNIRREMMSIDSPQQAHAGSCLSGNGGNGSGQSRRMVFGILIKTSL